MIRPLQKTHTFETDSGPMTIALYDILWVDSVCDDLHSPVRLHLADRVIFCKASFEDLLSVLGDVFLLCLTRGAVNQLRIRRFESEQIIFDTGASVAIDPFLSPRFQEKYCRDLARRVWED